MSTPTLVRTIRSSSAMSRVGAVNTRVLGECGSLVGGGGLGCRERRLRHREVDAFGVQPAAVLAPNEGVFLVVEDGPPAFVDAVQVAGFDVLVALVGDAPARVRPA